MRREFANAKRPGFGATAHTVRGRAASDAREVCDTCGEEKARKAFAWNSGTCRKCVNAERAA